MELTAKGLSLTKDLLQSLQCGAKKNWSYAPFSPFFVSPLCTICCTCRRKIQKSWQGTVHVHVLVMCMGCPHLTANKSNHQVSSCRRRVHGAGRMGKLLLFLVSSLSTAVQSIQPNDGLCCSSTAFAHLMLAHF